MNRRYWPAVLALLSVAFLGSYLLYTQHLVQQIRLEAAIQRDMFGDVQRGLLSSDESGQSAITALLSLQEDIRRLGVPVVVINAQGRPSASYNLPFHVDLNNPQDRIRVLRYAGELRRESGFITEPGVGEIYYGSPPILKGLRWIPLLQVSGGVLAVLVAFGLIRANVRAERERLWAAMARELAHQMGTPLSSMSGWLEMLQLPEVERKGMGDDRQIGREIRSDLDRLTRVSRRFELIGKKPELEAIQLEPLFRELERYLRPRLPRLGAGVGFKVRVLRGVPPVLANRVLLAWALENLVRNAVDALAGRGGRIRVVATPGPHGRVRIAVTDDGPGIPARIRERLFDPGVSSKAAGWGVGLSLTRRIVQDLHGGRISVRSRHAGGTEFIMDMESARPEGGAGIGGDGTGGKWTSS